MNSDRAVTRRGNFILQKQVTDLALLRHFIWKKKHKQTNKKKEGNARV